MIDIQVVRFIQLDDRSFKAKLTQSQPLASRLFGLKGIVFSSKCIRNNFKSPFGQSCKDLGHQRFVNKLSTCLDY